MYGPFFWDFPTFFAGIHGGCEVNGFIDLADLPTPQGRSEFSAPLKASLRLGSVVEAHNLRPLKAYGSLDALAKLTTLTKEEVAELLS